jgi:hypothetical protein
MNIDSEIKRNTTVAIVLVGILFFGILNSQMIYNLMDASDNVIIMAKGITFFTLIITQVGGWFVQSCFIYMLSFILGGNKPFNNYLALVGFAYIGFFITSVLTILINAFFVPDQLNPFEFKELIEQSMLHGIIGKAGEYWSLALISAGIFFLEDSFSWIKSIFISLLPNFTLLSLKFVFSYFI